MGAVAWSYRAFAEWHLGFADAARDCVQKGLALAQRRGRAHDIAATLSLGLLYHAVAGEPEPILAQVDGLLQLGQDHEVPDAVALGRIVRGWALAMQGRFDEGIPQLREGIELRTAIGHGAAYGAVLGLLAEALVRSGALADARAVVDEGFTALADGAVIDELALLHLRGELLARDGSADAETSFRAAIDLARRHHAKMDELRSTTGLARWLADRGRVAEAQGLLEPLRASFREGFAARDLQAAKALADEIDRAAAAGR
jgi:predicted ATPase